MVVRQDGDLYASSAQALRIFTHSMLSTQGLELTDGTKLFLPDLVFNVQEHPHKRHGFTVAIYLYSPDHLNLLQVFSARPLSELPLDKKVFARRPSFQLAELFA
jgi:hypothetical protein